MELSVGRTTASLSSARGASNLIGTGGIYAYANFANGPDTAQAVMEISGNASRKCHTYMRQRGLTHSGHAVGAENMYIGTCVYEPIYLSKSY